MGYLEDESGDDDMMVEGPHESPLFRESEVIVARRLPCVRHVADILDSSGEVLAEIRSRPRVMLGCLTIFVSGAAFGIPVLIGWLSNGMLRAARHRDPACDL